MKYLLTKDKRKRKNFANQEKRKKKFYAIVYKIIPYVKMEKNKHFYVHNNYMNFLIKESMMEVM